MSVAVRVRRLWSKLVAFVSEREDPASVACVRIAVGLTLCVHVARFWLSGAALFDAVDITLGGVGRPGPLGPLSPFAVHALCATVVVSAACVACGFLTRAAIVTTCASFRILIASAGLARGSYDFLMLDTLVVLFFSGCGRAFSVDNLLFARTRTANDDVDTRTVPRWPRMLLVLQIGMLYFGSAISKFGSGWVPGGDASAIWFILFDQIWSRFGTAPSWSWHITQIATTSVWLWEIASPLLVASIWLRERDASTLSPRLASIKRTLDRVHLVELWLLFGVAMHVGIEALLRVGPFSFAALSIYFVAFTPARVRRAIDMILMRPMRPST